MTHKQSEMRIFLNTLLCRSVKPDLVLGTMADYGFDREDVVTEIKRLMEESQIELDSNLKLRWTNCDT